MKELIYVKDINGFWSNVHCVSCSEGKNLSDSDSAIREAKACNELLEGCEFVVEDEEIYVMVSDISQVNPGDSCK